MTGPGRRQGRRQPTAAYDSTVLSLGPAQLPALVLALTLFDAGCTRASLRLSWNGRWGPSPLKTDWARRWCWW